MTKSIADQRTPGPNCLVDADGAHLCGAASLHKGSNGKIRLAVREGWEEALRRADLMRGECTFGPEYVDDKGKTRRDRLSCTCEVFTIAGVWQTRGHGESDRRGHADFGHIVSDARNGSYCGGNAVPEDSIANEEHGEHAPHISALFPMGHLRAAWREVAMERMTGTKRARVVA